MAASVSGHDDVTSTFCIEIIEFFYCSLICTLAIWCEFIIFHELLINGTEYHLKYFKILILVLWIGADYYMLQVHVKEHARLVVNEHARVAPLSWLYDIFHIMLFFLQFICGCCYSNNQLHTGMILIFRTLDIWTSILASTYWHQPHPSF